jgi:CBS domain-containing protein
VKHDHIDPQTDGVEGPPFPAPSRVADRMTRSVDTIGSQATLAVAEKLMRRGQVPYVAVVDTADRFVGILSEGDLRSVAAAVRPAARGRPRVAPLADRRVGEVVSRAGVTVRPDGTIEEAVVLMRERKLAVLPVVEESGRFVGLLTESDLDRGEGRARGRASSGRRDPRRGGPPQPSRSRS